MKSKSSKSLNKQLTTALAVMLVAVGAAAVTVGVTQFKSKDSTKVVNALSNQQMLSQAMGKSVFNYAAAKNDMALEWQKNKKLDQYISSMRKVYFSQVADSVKQHNAKVGKQNAIQISMTEGQGNLPFPATFQRAVNGHLSNIEGSKTRMMVLSKHPINPNQKFVSANDDAAWDYLKDRPNGGFMAPLKQDGKLFLEFYFPDMADQEKCVSCHNKMQGASYSLGDLFGLRKIVTEYTTFENAEKVLNPEITEYDNSLGAFKQTLAALKSGGKLPGGQDVISPITDEEFRVILGNVERDLGLFTDAAAKLIEATSTQSKIEDINKDLTDSEVVRELRLDVVSLSNKLRSTSEKLSSRYLELAYSAQHRMVFTLFASGVVIFAIMVVIGMAARRRLVTPLQVISQGLQKVAEGDRDLRFNTRQGSTELAQLTTNLNKVQESFGDALRTIQETTEEVKKANDDNEDAIVMLLEELSGLAEGDLSTEATVTESITGAIADSVNFTVTELRNVVEKINTISLQVSSAAEETQATAKHLADASDEQKSMITAASGEVLNMAQSVQHVTESADRSDKVAEEAVMHAKKGAEAVQHTIEGMDSIRSQIQETSKRIKRLGESSQEIGDIIELINDIADQTNILALNAAIQAAMAGEAGRGFAVVADEVQRLAERSTDATKKIESLVKGIQADTNEAVASMESSTNQVVNGSMLAKNAGEALQAIDKVSSDLAEIVKEIKSETGGQSVTAQKVREIMEKIEEITAQTSAGTGETAISIGTVAELANELKQSVSHFTLPAEAAEE